jgi:flavorubredoxin
MFKGVIAYVSMWGSVETMVKQMAEVLADEVLMLSSIIWL